MKHVISDSRPTVWPLGFLFGLSNTVRRREGSKRFLVTLLFDKCAPDGFTVRKIKVYLTYLPALKE